MRSLVFVGPTLFGADLNRFSFEFASPAGRGDIAEAIRAGYRKIVLIDGAFGDCPAVHHKEILWGLSRGVLIVGTASMGALRAAECHPFGMLGHGALFEEYATGTRYSDADVAVSHAPGELAFQPVSISLVDFHATLEKICCALPAQETDVLRTAADHCHFADRTIERVVRNALPADRHFAVTRRFRKNFVNRKQNEALAALEWFAGTAVSPPSDRCGNWRFSRTGFMRF